jgi:MutS domain V
MSSDGPKRSAGFVSNLLSSFGFSAEPILDWPFSPHEIARFHLSQTAPERAAIDDQTWRDLELDAYCNRVTANASIFAKQMLHHRLRVGAGDAEVAGKIDNIRLLQNDPSLHSKLRQTLLPLREVDTEISELLFTRQFEREPAWSKYLWLTPLVVATAIGTVYFSLYALIAVVTIVVAIILLQKQLEAPVNLWAREEESLRKLLRVCAQVGALVKEQNTATMSYFADLASKANAINRVITRLPVWAFIPGFTAYADWYFLKNIRHYFACLATLKKDRAFLQHCYKALANLEADVAIADEISCAPQTCWATRYNTKHIRFSDVVHPMLPDAQPLTIEFDNKGALVTGQNGVGKSTFLKAIGVNLIVGGAYGFCYAASAAISTLPVYASLNNPDSLSGGESSYVAELRRARELLQANENGGGGICLIDEIFRGTNHLESVCASAAVLHALTQNALVIASTHHIVLAPILAQWLTPIAIEAIASEEGKSAKLCIANGVLSHTNGIALLDTHGLGPDVSASARRVEAWLREYLAHPTMVPNLFAI